MKKRTWVYVQRPCTYEIAGHGCGNADPDWSEYEGCLWCQVCKVDYVPEHGGVFDGPVAVEAAGLMGLSFDRFNLETQKVETFKEWSKA